MIVRRSLALALALVFGAGMLSPALAQPKDNAGKTPAKTKTTKKTATAGTKTKAKKPHAKTAKTTATSAPGGGKSNKSGESRGLDRADQVASDHGSKGRDVARGKQRK